MAGVSTAVLVPGKGYTAQGPLLSFTHVALRRRGLDVRAMTWSPPDDLDGTTAAEWVTAQVEPELASAGRPVLVGKSLGSFAAPLAARENLPAIWFTPLLGQETVVAGLRAATAPMLLIGGTDDLLWDGEVARSLSVHLREIPGGDHSLLVPGRLAESARVLGEVADAVEDFLDAVLN